MEETYKRNDNPYASNQLKQLRNDDFDAPLKYSRIRKRT